MEGGNNPACFRCIQLVRKQYSSLFNVTINYNTVRKQVAFITIGQTPRVDMVPEVCEFIGKDIKVVELGALDELSLMKSPHCGRRITKIAWSRGSGTVVKQIVGKTWMRLRLQCLLDELNADDYFIMVLLCTGHFDRLRGKGLFLEAHSIVDLGVEAIAESARSLGVTVPLVEQIGEVHYKRRADQRILITHASPYAPGRLDEAARELKQADVIVMDCMGYTESMRQTVADVSGKPTLLARRLVAAAVSQLL